METYIEKHKAIIVSCYEPIIKTAKDGEIVPHKKEVREAFFYKEIYLNEQRMFVRIELERDLILDLASKINEMESEKTDMPVENFPF